MLTGPNLTAVRQRRPLTNDEVAAEGREIAALDGEISDLKGQKKEAARTFKGLIDDKEEEKAGRIKRIREGEEETVRCTVHFNQPTRGMKILWNPETLRIVSREAMLEKDHRDANLDFTEMPAELVQILDDEARQGKDAK
jgi:hypothetical protein